MGNYNNTAASAHLTTILQHHGAHLPTITMFSLVMLVTMFSSAMVMCIQYNTTYSEPGTTCPTCLLVRSSTNIQNSIPWLFNNPNTKFYYMRTDSRMWPIYQHSFGQNGLYYLHFYDEGLFYDGFYVVNDLETGYVEEDGRVFIYNSDSDDCPDDTGRNWYYWNYGDWKWDESINLQDCEMGEE